MIESTLAGLEVSHNDDQSIVSEIDNNDLALQLLDAIVLFDSFLYERAEVALKEITFHYLDEDSHEAMFLPVFLLLASIYASPHSTLFSPTDSINNYKRALRVVEKHHHGFGLDRVMIMIQLLQLYWSIREYDEALELAAQIDHTIMEMAYHHISLLTRRNLTSVGHVHHFFKWVCWVKSFISSKYIQCQRYQDAAMTLFGVIQFNETALDQGLSRGRTPTPQKNEFGKLVLDLIETAKLYQKLGHVYESVGQDQDAVDMYKRALYALYQHREQRNKAQVTRERDTLIDELIHKVASLIAKR